MLKRIPRQVFLVNFYGYIVVAVMVVVAALFLLSSDDLYALDLVILAALVIGAGLLWWQFHPRLNVGVPDAADDLRAQIRRSGQHTLLAFESEYCPMCMTIGSRVTQLESVEGLRVYRLSVNSEPGQTLFREYDGRLTPTYVLLGPHGERLQEWVIALPVERILYAVRQQSAA
jgi:thioredoxin-related protein